MIIHSHASLLLLIWPLSMAETRALKVAPSTAASLQRRNTVYVFSRSSVTPYSIAITSCSASPPRSRWCKKRHSVSFTSLQVSKSTRFTAPYHEIIMLISF